MQKYKFPIDLDIGPAVDDEIVLGDDLESMDELEVKEMVASSLSDAPPGITPISVTAVDVVEVDRNGIAWVLLDPREFFRYCIEYGEDPLDTLAKISKSAGGAVAKEVYQWAKGENFAIPHLSISPDGIEYDLWPKDIDKL